MLAILIPVPIAFVSLLYAFHMFDRLVQLQYGEHLGAWYSDGCPTGFFWRPPEISWIHGALAKEWLSLKWLFVTPEWAKRSIDGRHLLHHMRVAVLGWNVLLVATLFSAGLISLR